MAAPAKLVVKQEEGGISIERTAKVDFRVHLETFQ